MIDFPASPTVGQTFISGGSQWTWDGTKWAASGVVGANLVPAMNDSRIINGDMGRDQRNNGASGTASGYTVDRWSFLASQSGKGAWQRGSAGATLGFGYFLSFGSSSAYTPLAADSFMFFQYIEADMVSDFAWGTANAQPVTLSFLVNISGLTGTFSGSIKNDAGTRSYPFTFSVPTAGTWTKVVVTIPGDTAGTWVMSGNGRSVTVCFDLGGGSSARAAAGAWTSGNYNGATGAANIVAVNGAFFNLTGVKLEIGTVATPFNRQSSAKTLADCQRYFQTGSAQQQAISAGPTGYTNTFPLPVTMRGTPTITPTWVAQFNATGSFNPVSYGYYQFVSTVTVAAGTGYNVACNFTASAEL